MSKKVERKRKKPSRKNNTQMIKEWEKRKGKTKKIHSGFENKKGRQMASKVLKLVFRTCDNF
jgi:hypothetical protein